MQRRRRLPGAGARCRVFGRGVLAGLLLTGVACSTTRQVSLEHFPARGTGRARVTTQDGYTYDFARVTVRGDSLIGSYFVVEERVYGRDELAYVDVERRTRLPLASISGVEVRQPDYGGTALLGAGALLFAIWAHSVIEPDDPVPLGPGNTGKPPVGDP